MSLSVAPFKPARGHTLVLAFLLGEAAEYHGHLFGTPFVHAIGKGFVASRRLMLHDL